ncbi:MFS transporter [Curtobacterium sp. VKM Ac-2887]|uniref:MFS transporter n=1 Tax=Curtobacterium sp. VKM Ac-2887 TaxID=2783819 RepID=UPI00188AAF63|nr:MFS transporter [Curtobacterium sp. VKM Ac-2887]MBF4585697.1 MFS transporter [Curtobacterium sp. VKM Ac-2887]
MTQTEAIPAVALTRSPRGYVPSVAFASFGLFLALLGPTIGGLSVKVQSLVGLADAPARLGLVTGVGLAFSLVTQPLAGRLSDRSMSRFGRRRPFLLVGVVGLLLALIGCGVAPNVFLLLVAWCGCQFFGSIAQAAMNATVADQVPVAKRGGVSGILGAATPAGLLIGAVLLNALPNEVLRFVVPGIIAVVLMVVFTGVLKDHVRTQEPSTTLNLRQLLTSFIFDPRKHPDFGWALLSRGLILVAYGSVSTYLTLFLATSYGMNTQEQLAFNAIAQIIGVGTLIAFSVVGGFVSDRAGRRKLFIVISGLVIAVGVAGTALSPLFGHSGGLTVLLVAQALTGAGAGCFFAVDQAMCLSVLPNPDDTAKDLGILNAAGALPGALAPLLAGLVFIPLGNALFDGGYTLWFAVGAAMAIAGSFVVLRIRQVR